MIIIVLAEHDGKSLKASTLNTITAANKIGGEIHVLLAGFQCESIAKEISQIDCVQSVLLADNKIYQHPLAERIAPLVVAVSKEASHILAPATTFGKNILPRVAALLDVGQMSDIVEVLDQNTYRRPIYAGNAIETLQSSDQQQVITVRTTAFDPVAIAENTAEITAVDFTTDNQQSEFISEEKHASDRPELSSAAIVISGGRGLKDKKTFERLTAIADAMNAAIGASRAAVDAGLAPNDCQVGQTGQIVAPKLYFAVGISGAIQHLAGMKDSGVIVAINKDPDAPIFQIANYGLVADINDVLPLWEAAVTPK
jgi:electron transfer flavoprotein alpha subunit